VALPNYPTHDKHVLNIFSTNQPSHITSCSVVPDIRLYLLSQSWKYTYVAPPDGLYTYGAELTSATLMMLCFSIVVNSYSKIQNTIETPIQEPWKIFKDICKKFLNLIPSRLTSKCYNQLWINANIKWLTRSKHRLYIRACTTGV